MVKTTGNKIRFLQTKRGKELTSIASATLDSFALFFVTELHSNHTTRETFDICKATTPQQLPCCPTLDVRLSKESADLKYQQNRFLATLWQLQRVQGQQNAVSTSGSLSASFLARRLYATATATKAKPTTAKKPATKKASTKTPATAKKPATKKPAKKPAKKPVKKSAKKVKAKAKPKPKKKVAKKVVLTDSQVLRRKLKELKVTALVSEDPKQKPQNAFRVLFEELTTGSGDVISSSKLASTQFKSASTAELERLNRIANENKAANLVTYKKWVESHTPEEIRLANLARLHMRRLTHKIATPKIIKDDRAPKNRTLPLAFFVQERFRSGEFAGIKVTESIKRISDEYKELTPTQRKTYEDAAAADAERYDREYKTVFKREPGATYKTQAEA
ncbi:hypothetical protein DID88_003520 [Monilinia fructigena]|uniref:HMG box domain-containing protein n=1 Tax=Monilinia fructigena TaxID=38457 RepID=A0A395IU95_9HELO|nr:hypothetical protein DID88_003520 [Monilinia fructigena]